MLETLLPDEPEYELLIDDTPNNHVGRQICAAAVQHDGAAPKTGKGVGYGVCFVTIGLAVRLPGISDRVFCLPYAARVWWPKKSMNKPKGAQYKSKTDLAAQLVRLTKSWVRSAVTLRVIVDGAYSNNKLIVNRPKGVRITGKLRTDAALYALVEPQKKRGIGRPRLKEERLPTPQTIFNDPTHVWDGIWICLSGKETMLAVHQFQAIWYKAAKNEPLSIVLVRDPDGKYPDTAYFDTDTTASDQETIQRYSHRWSTEITYRETKSPLGSGDPQCRKEKAVLRTPMIAYWSYSLVVIWFVTQLRNVRVPQGRSGLLLGHEHAEFGSMGVPSFNELVSFLITVFGFGHRLAPAR